MSQDEPEPTAGPVNWEAYSHEELYRMLWQDADVADVSQVATEWARHRVALDTHAQVLREQRVALLDSWQGPAAEEAAERLAALAARVEKISELAHAGQVAAQEAADALAMARAMMPPPPAPPVVPLDGQGTAFAPALPGFAAPPAPAFPGFAAPPALPTAPAAFSGPRAFPEPPSLPSFAPPPAPQAFPAAPTFPMAIPTTSPAPYSIPDYATTYSQIGSQMGSSAATMGAAFGAVGGAGSSFYFGAVSAEQQRAEAIRAMRAYESSLLGGGRLLDSARGAIPPASQLTHTSAQAAGPGGSSPGVPWTRLLGGGGVGVGGRGGAMVGVPAAGVSTPVTGHGGQLAPGQRVGLLPGAGGLFGAPGGAFAGEQAGARGTAQAAMGSPAGGRVNGGDDEPHENRMPTIDHGLFRVDATTSPAVLGQSTGAHS